MTENELKAFLMTVSVVLSFCIAILSPIALIVVLSLAFACFLIYRSSLALLNALDMYKEKKQ